MKQVIFAVIAALVGASQASAERLVGLESEFALLEAAIAGEAAAAEVDPWDRCVFYTNKVAKFCNPGPNYNSTICSQYEVLMEEWCKKAEEDAAALQALN